MPCQVELGPGDNDFEDYYENEVGSGGCGGVGSGGGDDDISLVGALLMHGG